MQKIRVSHSTVTSFGKSQLHLGEPGDSGGVGRLNSYFKTPLACSMAYKNPGHWYIFYSVCQYLGEIKERGGKRGLTRAVARSRAHGTQLVFLQWLRASWWGQGVHSILPLLSRH